MGLKADCVEYFGTEDLYGVLSVAKSATYSELKTAYRKRSLIIHPDHAQEQQKEIATSKFQVLAKAYFILSERETRQVYDDSGLIDDENVFSEDKNWAVYWRLLFPKLEIKTIDEFMKSYKGSEEERSDLRQIYMQCSGDMNKMCDHIMGYDYIDEERYREILLEMIEAEEIPSFRSFIDEMAIHIMARKRKFEKEATEAKALRKRFRGGMDETGLEVSLTKKMMQRKDMFDDLMARIESKYGRSSKNGN